MKIKSVCEQTNLTDRAIRYYIEEGLLAPAFTENYLGRRTFDFSQTDVERLREIAVLRKFGFSVSEIRTMYARPDSICDTLSAAKDRKESALTEEQELLQVLTQAEVAQPESVCSLVSFLAEPVKGDPLPATDESRVSFPRFLRAAGLFLAAWLPPVLCIAAFLLKLYRYHYPVFSGLHILLTLLSLLPSAFMILLPRLSCKKKRRPIATAFILVGCIISIVFSPILSLGILVRSETTDLRHYRELDPDCLANRSELYQNLFPKWPHTVDAHYLYRRLPAIDYTYDIYAEWPLEEADFRNEIVRASAALSVIKESYLARGYSFVTIRHGAFTCLVLYKGDALFAPVSDSYTYGMFAYNETDRRVRYLYCESLENGADQPYFLELDWI
ncbi:MAG: MerR family transcriptional regulator [Clostridia bacterium]|nr:MerR family transcriptional regulator [Clostridia bacterium]